MIKKKQAYKKETIRKKEKGGLKKKQKQKKHIGEGVTTDWKL